MTTQTNTDLTDLNDLSDLFNAMDKENMSTIGNSKITISKKRKSSVATKRKYKGKKRKSIFRGKNIILNKSKAQELLFSPESCKQDIFTPGSRSRSSVRTKIELNQILKEAQEFLKEPNVVYEPPKETPISF